MDVDNIIYEHRNLDISKWYYNNKHNFDKIQDGYVGYQLCINRPTWFQTRGRVFCEEDLAKEDTVAMVESCVFVGKTKEEVLLKMYKYCLQNLKWQNGTPVNLMDYSRTNKFIDESILIDQNNNEYVELESTDQQETKIIIRNENKEKFDETLMWFIINHLLNYYGLDEQSWKDGCFTIKAIKLM